MSSDQARGFRGVIRTRRNKASDDKGQNEDNMVSRLQEALGKRT